MTEKRKVPPLHPSGSRLMEHAIRQWHIVLPEGVSIDDAMEPGFWVHVANYYNIGDEVRLVANDGSFKAWATVEDKTPGGLKLVADHLRTSRPIELGDVKDDTPYRVRHRGFGNFEVLRVRDAHHMSSHRSKEEALRAMHDLVARMAA